MSKGRGRLRLPPGAFALRWLSVGQRALGRGRQAPRNEGTSLLVRASADVGTSRARALLQPTRCRTRRRVPRHLSVKRAARPIMHPNTAESLGSVVDLDQGHRHGCESRGPHGAGKVMSASGVAYVFDSKAMALRAPRVCWHVGPSRARRLFTLAQKLHDRDWGFASFEGNTEADVSSTDGSFRACSMPCSRRVFAMVPRPTSCPILASALRMRV